MTIHTCPNETHVVLRKQQLAETEPARGRQMRGGRADVELVVVCRTVPEVAFDDAKHTR